ncbi:protein translocase subunit SecD [Desertibaculum subflavum]|uniref:protein translocase subunit SecD n=1 Tax=Desertibaculum subflavum TaxID=2268458 RepID=UPI000E66A484
MLYFAPWKIVVILVTCLLGILFAVPNLFTREQLATLPGWMPAQQVNLGLDLRGGAYLLLEVDLEGVQRERLESLVESVRSELQAGRIRYTGLGVVGNAVQVRIRDAAQFDTAREALNKIPQPLSAGFLGGSGGKDVQIEAGPDGLFTLSFAEQGLKERADAAISESIEIVRRRIDELGVTEPSIQRQGADRIIVQLPGVGDPGRIEEILGTTAKMTFRMVDTSPEAIAGRTPPGSMLLTSDTERGADGKPRTFVVRKKIEVDGDELENAQAALNQQTGQWVVNFRFNSAGGRKFANVTKENVGKPFAIVLDNKVISAPVIREPILGGSGQISGNFNVQTANDLALLLRAGALPAPLNVVERRAIGPDLGADSIRAGWIASVIGFALVVVFVFAAYGLFGLFANIALVLNLVLLVGLLSLLQATLTLPGIAGIVLTMGMAVDANVLIFERIREEQRLGRGVIGSIDAGFKRAMSTILDSNLTTILTAIVLFSFGTGPVRGFAVTLMLGIAISMFTAIWVCRLMLAEWVRRRRPRQLYV